MNEAIDSRKNMIRERQLSRLRQLDISVDGIISYTRICRCADCLTLCAFSAVVRNEIIISLFYAKYVCVQRLSTVAAAGDSRSYTPDATFDCNRLPL